ncbi:MAG: Gfo/Idh/MocA family oxidoreductase, partial [Nitrospiraceae bacterium]
MEHSDPTKVAILGAGRGGRALLDLLHQLPSIEIVGIADRDPAAPGLQRARTLHIPVATNLPDLISNHGVQLIMDVTGNPEIEIYLKAHKPPTADILSGSASRLLWELVQHESKLEG